MSAYHEYEVNFTDRDALIKALALMKNSAGVQFKETQIESHDAPVALIDYVGKVRPQRADIVIRRAAVGQAANDLGFEKTATGYRAHISEFDRHHYNEAWTDKLKQNYSEIVVGKQAAKLGYNVTKTVKDGKTVMKLTAWR